MSSHLASNCTILKAVLRQPKTTLRPSTQVKPNVPVRPLLHQHPVPAFPASYRLSLLQMNVEPTVAARVRR